MTASELDALVEKFKNGDSESFDAIYYETQKTVYLSIRTIISKRQVVEDLMQDTYMKMIDGLPSYKLGTNFKAWISRIARNLAINHYTKEKRIEICDLQDPIFYREEESQSKLNYYLSFLDGLEREVVIYHLVLDFGFSEIARIINVPLSTAFLMYKKGIAKIKKGLKYE